MAPPRLSEGTAREWLVVLAAGVLVLLVASVWGSDGPWIFGVLLTLFGAVGLTWRLLKNR